MKPATQNLSVNVLSIFEDDRTKQSRIQVKVANNERELSKFFYINALGQEAVDGAIVLGVKDFAHFEGVIAAAFTDKTTTVKTDEKVYAQADGSTSSVPGEIPPPIPTEAKKETAKRAPRTTKPAESKLESGTTAPAKTEGESNGSSNDEWEEVKSPYAKGEESKAGTKADSGKEVKKVETGKTTPHIKYDKTIKEHRSTLATHLNTAHPAWKTSGVDISAMTTELVGKDFLDVKGNIVPEFKADVALYF